jgi:hypothetical protein
MEPGGDMSSQSELFDRAAECERLMDAASDSDKKQIYRQLHDMWMALANETAIMTADEMTEKIAEIERLQMGLSQ